MVSLLTEALLFLPVRVRSCDPPSTKTLAEKLHPHCPPTASPLVTKCKMSLATITEPSFSQCYHLVSVDYHETATCV